MKNEKTSKILFIIFYVLAMISFVLNIVLGCALMVERDKAYAEIDTTQILNFNQYIPNEYINHSYDNNFYTIQTFTEYIPVGHTIYYNYEGSGVLLQYYDGTYYYDFTGNYFTLTANMRAIRLYSNANNNTVNNLNVIDLTQMFGANVPTLSECQQIFTAEYYNYETGKPLTLSGLNAYDVAMKDILSSYKYTLSMSALTSSTYAVDYNNVESIFAYDNNGWYFKNTFAVPLQTQLNTGALISVDYQFYAPNLESAYYLNVMVNNNGQYQTIYTNTEQINTSNVQTMTFTLPYASDTLYFNIVYDNSIWTSANFLVFNFDISASNLDINSIVHYSYLSGQNDILSQYAVNGTKYMEIYNYGVQEAETNASVFHNAWEFVGSAFSGVGEMLAIELIPNVPIGLFVAFPLLLGLIFFIVKLTKGGS